MYLVQGNPHSFLRIYPRDLAPTLNLHYEIVNKNYRFCVLVLNHIDQSKLNILLIVNVSDELDLRFNYLVI